MVKRVLRPEGIRRENAATLLRFLQHQAATRAKLSSEHGLTKATIGELVSELHQRGLVTIGQPDRRGSVGRPGREVALVADRVVGLGFEINVNYIVGVAIDLLGRQCAYKRRSVTVNRIPVEATLRVLVEIAEDLLAEVAQRDRPVLVSGMCVGVPGFVDESNGIVRLSPNLGWTEIPARDLLRDILPYRDIRIQIDNEGNLGALAEYRKIVGMDSQELLYVAAETSIDGGIVTGGRLLRGARNFAGEFGHMRLSTAAGLTCSCGRVGCWETTSGLVAFLRKAGDTGDLVRDPYLDLSERLNTIIQRANDGDGRALSAISLIAHDVARGLSSLMTVFNPDRIVLGGYFAELGEQFLSQVMESVAVDHGGEIEGQIPQITLAQTGFVVSATGGGYTALETVIDNPMLIPPEDPSNELPSQPASGKPGSVNGHAMPPNHGPSNALIQAVPY